MILACLAFAYGCTSTAIAVLVGRCIKPAERPEPAPQPEWACPADVDGLFAELEDAL